MANAHAKPTHIKGFSLSQNAAAEASNRQLHISTSKGPNGCCFNETLKRLVTIPQDLWIITLIPAWDHDNFVWRIWNHCERCDSIEKLAISTFAHRSCLLLIGAKIFLSFRLIIKLFPIIHFMLECLWLTRTQVSIYGLSKVTPN